MEEAGVVAVGTHMEKAGVVGTHKGWAFHIHRAMEWGNKAL
jgi:hypothetical protein